MVELYIFLDMTELLLSDGTDSDKIVCVCVCLSGVTWS